MRPLYSAIYLPPSQATLTSPSPLPNILHKDYLPTYVFHQGTGFKHFLPTWPTSRWANYKPPKIIWQRISGRRSIPTRRLPAYTINLPISLIIRDSLPSHPACHQGSIATISRRRSTLGTNQRQYPLQLR